MKRSRVLKRFTNMQRIVMSVVLLVVGVAVFAQYPPTPNSLEKYKKIDVATQVLQYKLKFKLNFKQKDYYEDDRIVQIGNQFVKDYSGIIFYFDSLKTVNDKKGLPSPSIPHPVFNYEMFNDFKLGVSKLKYLMDLNGGAICYTAQLPKLNWAFVSDSTNVVLDYTCNLARTHFAGRDYNVWYAVDVPLPYGPYKFYGLPGLIMKVEESTGLYIWEITSMQNAVQPIYEYTYEAEQKSSEIEAIKAITRLRKNPIRFLEQLGRHMSIKGTDGRLRPSTSIPNIPDQEYEPLEKY